MWKNQVDKMWPALSYKNLSDEIYRCLIHVNFGLKGILNNNTLYIWISVKHLDSLLFICSILECVFKTKGGLKENLHALGSHLYDSYNNCTLNINHIFSIYHNSLPYIGQGVLLVY